MYCVLCFSSKLQARRCAKFCSASGVLCESLPLSRYLSGVAQLRIPAKFEKVVLGCFSDFVCQSLLYA